MKEIALTKGKVALVDDEDYETLNRLQWYASKDRNTWYAATRQVPRLSNGKQGFLRMHRSILNAPVDMQVDHINGNGLDNRRANLRLVSQRGNSQNRMHIKKTSKYPGVSWSEKSQKWRATINHGNKQTHIGYFDDEREAYSQYLKLVPNKSEILKHPEVMK